MYKRTDRRRLYQIVKMYLEGKITELSFSDEFYFSFDQELDLDNLTEEENHVFGELSDIVSRFSEFERDHKECPGVFYTKEDVKLKIQETKKKLGKYFDELEKKGELD